MTDILTINGVDYAPVSADAIEQHEAFRQEVSDAVERAVDDCGHDGLRKAYIHSRFFRFIIAKPDPLVQALQEVDEFACPEWVERIAPQLRAALAKRGLKIVSEQEKNQ